MSKIAIVYWSGTGNTESMAYEVLEGIKSNNGVGEIFTATEFSPEMIDDFETIIFGCPSMGAEVLEESEFEPMFSACETKLSGKKVALFGSYGWGDGEWMRNWETRCKEIGAVMVHDCLICNEAPDEAAKEECRNLGKSLV